MARSTECAAVVARVEELAALTAMHAQLEEPHLVVCAECREEVAHTRDLLSGLDAIGTRAPQGDLSERVMAKIAAAPPPAWAARTAARPIPRAVPAPPAPQPPGFMAFLSMRAMAVPAFAMAVALFAVVAFRTPGRELAQRAPAASPIVEEPVVADRSAPPIQVAQVSGRLTAFDQGTWKDIAAGGTVAAGQRVQVARGGRAALALPDGSRVELASETELVPFADRVRLRHGAARFDVKHRPERTFRVLVPDGEVRVLGTLFTVDAKSAGSLVHLLAGRLEVQCGNQVERLEDGDSATIGDGRLAKQLASASGLPPGTESARPDAFPSDVAAPSDAPVGADPRPAVQATAASGAAPDGLR